MFLHAEAGKSLRSSQNIFGGRKEDPLRFSASTGQPPSEAPVLMTACTARVLAPIFCSVISFSVLAC